MTLKSSLYLIKSSCNYVPAFTILSWSSPPKKIPWSQAEKSHRGCTSKHKPIASCLPSSFHPTFPVTFSIDEVITGLLLVITGWECIMEVTRIQFQQIPNKHTRLSLKCLIDSTLTISRELYVVDACFTRNRSCLDGLAKVMENVNLRFKKIK